MELVQNLGVFSPRHLLQRGEPKQSSGSIIPLCMYQKTHAHF
ncbi:hypothetical protein NSP_24480 [Nodularia spumigena CCY9414]|nr:hypothetical protein NSP_24480 [Nodularia spumigena CCY9414]